jgi:glycosyltransferase involved in cell wall biosynthesis
MIELRKKVFPSHEKGYFSILIPSWNNLNYLKLCINSIRQHSHFKHQLIVVVNEGKDGTIEWIENQQDIDYVYSKENIGICYALNACRSIIKTDYILYANDDMYFLPDWDLPIWNEIQTIGHNHFMLSSTMIEPLDTNNPCVIVQNHGTSIETFKETDLLKEYNSQPKINWNGSTWPPNILHIEIWDLIGGMSVEFSPGMYSDPDLSKKCWDLGIRYFKGLGDSRVYHFGCKSTKRIKQNKGSSRFLFKWGLDSNAFVSCYLKRGKPFLGELQEPVIPRSRKINFLLKKLRKIWGYK